MQIRLFGGLDRKSKLHKIPETYAQLAANFTYTGRRFRPIYGMLQLEQVPDNTDQLFLVETIQATNSNTFTQVASTVSESNVGHALTDVGFETWQVWYPNRYSSLMPALFESNVGHGMLDVSAEVWQTWFPVRYSLPLESMALAYEFAIVNTVVRDLVHRIDVRERVDYAYEFTFTNTSLRDVVIRRAVADSVEFGYDFNVASASVRDVVVRTVMGESIQFAYVFHFITTELS